MKIRAHNIRGQSMRYLVVEAVDAGKPNRWDAYAIELPDPKCLAREVPFRMARELCRKHDATECERLDRVLFDVGVLR